MNLPSPASQEGPSPRPPAPALRVLHVIPAVAARYGGPSHAVLEIVRECRRQGVDAYIATTDADGPDRLEIEYDRLVEYGGCPVSFFPRQWSEALKYSHPLSRWLREHVRDFDLVHVHAVFSHACVAAGRACRRSGVPYIVRPLGTLDPWSLGQKAGRKRLFWALAGRRLVAGAAAVHYTSERERQRAERALGLASGVVLSLGVDLPAESPEGLAPAPPYLLFLSRLHPKKGLEIVIDAMADLGDSIEGTLVVAGNGPPEYVRALRERASRSANGRVRFVGWVDGEVKTDLLSGAAALLAPSHQENLGFSMLEAMAREVPVLASRHVDLAEEIERHGAGWIAEDGVEALREQLRMVLTDVDSRRQRGRAARALVASRYNRYQSTTALLGLYRRILAEAPLTPWVAS